MPESRKTKAPGADGTRNRKKPTPEEMGRMAEEKPMTGLIPAMTEQDRLDGGEEHHLQEEPEDGEEFNVGNEEECEESHGEDFHEEESWEPDEASEESVETLDGQARGTRGVSDSESLEGAEGVAAPVLDTESRTLSRRKETVRKINRKVQETVSKAQKLADEGALDIGDILLDDEFNGRVEDVLSRNPRKAQSLTKIAQDPDLTVDRRQLGRWARAAALRRDLRNSGVDVSVFSLATYEALLLEHDSDLRRTLALQVIREGLSARDTRKLIREVQAGNYPEDIGKVLRTSIAHLIDTAQNGDLVKTGSNKDLLEKDLSRRDRKILLDQIRHGKPHLAKLPDFLRDLERNLESIDNDTPPEAKEE